MDHTRRGDYWYAVGGRMPELGDIVRMVKDAEDYAPGEFRVVDYDFSHSTGRTKLQRTGMSRGGRYIWRRPFALVLVQGHDDDATGGLPQLVLFGLAVVVMGQWMKGRA